MKKLIIISLFLWLFLPVQSVPKSTNAAIIIQMKKPDRQNLFPLQPYSLIKPLNLQILGKNNLAL
jgi:hypothetical protein